MLARTVLLAAAEDKRRDHRIAAPAGRPQWTEFKSAERKASPCPSPAPPKATSAPVEGQNPLVQYDFQVSLGEDTVYSVVVFEYPPARDRIPTPTLS